MHAIFDFWLNWFRKSNQHQHQHQFVENCALLNSCCVCKCVYARTYVLHKCKLAKLLLHEQQKRSLFLDASLRLFSMSKIKNWIDDKVWWNKKKQNNNHYKKERKLKLTGTTYWLCSARIPAANKVQKQINTQLQVNNNELKKLNGL